MAVGRLKATIGLVQTDELTRAGLSPEKELIDIVGTHVYQRIRAAVRRHIGKGITDIEDIITRAATAGAIAEGLTGKDIARLTAEELTARVITWARTGGGIIIIDLPQKKRAEDAGHIGGLARVTSSVAMATSSATIEEAEAAAIRRQYSSRARVAMILIARLVPQKGAAEPTTLDELIDPSFGRVTLTEVQEGALAKALFTRNNPRARQDLIATLTELSKPITCTTRIKGADGKTRKAELQHARLIDYVRVRDDKTGKITGLRINVSGLFYSNMKHHADINADKLLPAYHGVHGAEYVDILLWYTAEKARIEASKEDITLLFPYSATATYDVVKEDMKRRRRRACRAVANEAAHDMGASSWVGTPKGILFTWQKASTTASTTTPKAEETATTEAAK